MPIKKQIYGDYTIAVGQKPAHHTTAEAEFIRQEAERKQWENRQNERRFDQYNTRLQAAGLSEIPYADFLARKYGTFAELKRAERALHAIGAEPPDNRDNITLFTR